MAIYGFSNVLKWFLIFFCQFRILFSSSVTRDQEFSFSITKTWNGKPTGHPPIVMTLREDSPANQLVFKVMAPFYDDPKPAGKAGKPTEQMWKHEVVELYFANANNEYLQIQLGPYGHHLVLFFKGERKLLRHSLPLNSETTIKTKAWEGTVTIPGSYFPPKASLFNAFAMSGLYSDNTRKHWALYPEDGTSPKANFHQLKYFRPLGLKGPYAHQTKYSKEWKEAYAESASSSIFVSANRNCQALLIGTLAFLGTKFLF